MSFTQEKGLNIGENFKNQKIVFPHITPKQKTTKCDGCDKKCEYGYVKLTGEKYLPKLGEVFVTAYYNESGDRVVLFPDKISPEMARAEAEKIARVCEHNRARVK